MKTGQLLKLSDQDFFSFIKRLFKNKLPDNDYEELIKRVEELLEQYPQDIIKVLHIFISELEDVEADIFNESLLDISNLEKEKRERIIEILQKLRGISEEDKDKKLIYDSLYDVIVNQEGYNKESNRSFRNDFIKLMKNNFIIKEEERSLLEEFVRFLII